REAEVRKGARTSKTANRAQRRGVILTVLASLATRFERFTLDNLLSEVTRWWETGLSIFEQELAELHPTKIPPILPAETERRSPGKPWENRQLPSTTDSRAWTVAGASPPPPRCCCCCWSG